MTETESKKNLTEINKIYANGCEINVPLLVKDNKIMLF